MHQTCAITPPPRAERWPHPLLSTRGWPLGPAVSAVVVGASIDGTFGASIRAVATPYDEEQREEQVAALRAARRGEPAGLRAEQPAQDAHLQRARQGEQREERRAVHVMTPYFTMTANDDASERERDETMTDDDHLDVRDDAFRLLVKT